MPKKSHLTISAIHNFVQNTKKHLNSTYIVGIMFVRLLVECFPTFSSRFVWVPSLSYSFFICHILTYLVIYNKKNIISSLCMTIKYIWNLKRNSLKGPCATKHLRFEVLNVWFTILPKWHIFVHTTSGPSRLSESAVHKENMSENYIHFPAVEMEISRSQRRIFF